MALLQGHDRPEEEREDGCGQADLLHKASPHQFRSKHVPGDPHDGKYTCIDHRYRMQQGRDGRRRHRSGRQPVEQRKDGCFRAKAEETEQKRNPHDLLAVSAGQAPAVNKLPTFTGEGRQHNREKCQRSTADRVSGIFPARIHTVMVAVVRHERDRHKRQHFIEHVHRCHIRRERDAGCRPVRHDIKREEGALPFLMFHIGKCVQHHRRPHHREHAREYRTESVDGKCNGKA